MSKTFSANNLAYSALLIAMLCVSAYIKIPTPLGVPFTLQVLIVFIIACILEKKLAALTVFVYVLLGLVGLPVFSGGSGGFSYVFYPTFGYLIGFILGAYVLSSIYKSNKFNNKIISYIVGSALCILIIYTLGISYYYLIKDIYMNDPIPLAAAITGLTFPYILLDTAKSVVAYFIVIALEKALHLNK